MDNDIENVSENRRGKGPFHLKRIGLGSFALTLKRYTNPITLADLVNYKDTAPDDFAKIVTPKFIEFFESYDPGHIHAITQAPKSRRHLDRTHPMDIVCATVARHLGCKYVEIFEPWEKTGRGRGVKHPLKITTNPNIKELINKIVYVLDDVATTGETLRLSCRAMTAMSIHTHAVAFILWS